MTVVLVTGITGQDGSYLTERLLAAGAEVHGLVRNKKDANLLQHRHSTVVSHVGDMSDSAQIFDLIEKIEPDDIYNLAGISSVALSWEQPVLAALVNGVAVAAILEAARALQERTGKTVRVLQASSGEIFGTTDILPQTENTPFSPSSPYGAAKAFAQHLVRIYRQRGLHVVSCILYNHESPRRAESFVTRKITAGVANIAVNGGGSLQLGNLDARRDWGWAPDYVEAMILALNYHKADDYIIATGVSSSVRDFVRLAFQQIGIPNWQDHIVSDSSMMRPADPVELRGDPDKARTVLGWEPRHGLAAIVRQMVDEDVLRSRSTTSGETEWNEPCQDP